MQEACIENLKHEEEADDDLGKGSGWVQLQEWTTSPWLRPLLLSVVLAAVATGMAVTDKHRRADLKIVELPAFIWCAFSAGALLPLLDRTSGTLSFSSLLAKVEHV